MEMQLQEASDQIDSYYKQASNAVDTDTVDIVSSAEDARAWQYEVSTERDDLNVETNSSYYEELIIELPLSTTSEVILFKKDLHNTMDLFTCCFVLVLLSTVILLYIVMKSRKDTVEIASAETAETHIAPLVTITTTVSPLQTAAEPNEHVPLSPVHHHH